jgi:dolichol-phosphate mannosyltransferase
MHYELSVIIPVLNEIGTLPEIIQRVQALPISKEIIVVDNGSTDGTREFLGGLDGVRKVFQPKNLGRGTSVRRGIELATGEYTAIHDADLEYCPEDLVQMLAIARNQRADVVYGSRVLGGRKTNYFTYYLAIRFLTSLINTLCGAHLTDAGTALKMVRTSLFQKIEQRCSGFEWDFEVTTKLCLTNAKVVEYAARYRPRTHQEGKKLTALDGFPSLWAILWSWATFRRDVRWEE